MVTRTRKQNAAGNKRKLKVEELKLNKETVKDLSASQQKQIQGGARATADPKYCVSGIPYEGGCATHIYKGGPCGLVSQLDCI